MTYKEIELLIDAKQREVDELEGEIGLLNAFGCGPTGINESEIDYLKDDIESLRGAQRGL